MERTRPYNFTVKWIAGKDNVIADALSRAPVWRHQAEDCEEEELAVRVGRVLVDNRIAPGALNWHALAECARHEGTYQDLMSALRSKKKIF